MDIRNWGLSSIMQLPDSCLGRRRPLGLYRDVIVDQIQWDICEIALPERFVLWEVCWWSPMTVGTLEGLRLALGDHLPTTNAEMMEFEPLLPGIGRQGPDPRQMMGQLYGHVRFATLKMPFYSMGRRLVGEFDAAATGGVQLEVVIVISGIPNEVPDCLLSG